MADVIIGASLQADDQISPKVKNIKQELRAAQEEVVSLSQKFGATSKEAAAAAKKAADLKDAIGDARTLVDAFNPDTKFKAFGAAINTVTGGFTALTGAMALLGVESEDVQKTLLKVQSALAISQGVSQLQEGIQSFKNLKTVLIDTLGKSGAIGLAVAGVGLLTAYVTGLFENTNKLAESEKELVKGFVAAKKEMTALANTIDQAKKGIISKGEALKAYNDTLGKVTGKTNDLETAERLMVENADKYVQVQALKAQANFLLQQSAEKSAQAELMRMKLSEEDLPRFLRNNLERQIQKDLDGLKVYDNAVKDINERIKAVRFSVTTSGLGSSVGGGDKAGAAGGSGGSNSTGEDIIAEAEKRVKLRREAEEAERERKAMMDKHMRAREIIADQSNYIITSKATENDVIKGLDDARTHNEQINAEARIKLSELETAQKLEAAQSVGNALGALSDLVGKQTAAGKVLGIAQATINTFIGATEVLRAKSTLPEPLGTIVKIANVTAIIASGLSAVKNIMKVQVPGGSGGGGSVPSVSAPLQAQLPTASTTSLDQRSLNQIGNATSRAFVVESDITNNQERIRRLNRAARLG